MTKTEKAIFKAYLIKAYKTKFDANAKIGAAYDDKQHAELDKAGAALIALQKLFISMSDDPDVGRDKLDMYEHEAHNDWMKARGPVR